MPKKTPIDPAVLLQRFVERHDTQRDAARALGISQSYLTDLIYGRRLCSDRILEQLGGERVVVEKSA